ncbi:alpha-L-fucosidase [Puniceicoccaceae bacterium K14]|nr:alpha-L-fucosidase [Puniceicoccaceae bacterium K14]
MNRFGKIFSVVVLNVVCAGCAHSKQQLKVEPTWESMVEHYNVPQWFVDGKIGVWTHWGVPSGTDENRPNDGSHYGRRMYGPIEGEKDGQRRMSQALSDFHTERYGHPSEYGYEKLVPFLKAENWDPEGLVKFFKDNGARFIMPVATHHDNFDMYDSFHPWNAVDMGPKRDTIQEWKDAASKYGLKFGVSTHLYWSPRFFATARQYQKPGTDAWTLFNMDYDPKKYASQDSWNEHWYDRCWELIDKYDPDMFNNDSPYPSEDTGKSLGVKLFSDYINRDLKENEGKQTTVLSFKNGNMDRRAFTYNLERGSSGVIQPEPWMWATDVSGNWFYRKDAVNRMSIPVLVGNAVDAISKNGIVMLNVALRGDGTLPENQAAYITAVGDFLKTCGEGIYGSRPWKTYGEGPLEIKTGRQGENIRAYSQEDIRFTTKDGNLYVFVLATPTSDILVKTLAEGGLLDKEISGVQMLGSEEEIQWSRSSEGLRIELPDSLPEQLVAGFKLRLE